jgi:bacterioferritin-associated ferredoxin
VAVNRCICRRITFAHALAVARRNRCGTVADLQRHVELGTGCGLCVPYMQRSLLTGETDLPVLDERETALLLASSGIMPSGGER